jgi:uncharacterized protein (DUF1697 family)
MQAVTSSGGGQIAMNRSQVFSTHLALLRGINLADKNRLLMRDLVEIFVDTGCTDVRTHIQSGNVIFGASPGALEGLPGRIASQIEERFGCRIPVILRTAGELGHTIRNNPFVKAGKDENTLHVLFLAGRPDPKAVGHLDPDRSPPDEFLVGHREIYLHLPNGVARTKLNNAYFDSKLATISTGRNWRTVLKLFEMMRG